MGFYKSPQLQLRQQGQQISRRKSRLLCQGSHGNRFLFQNSQYGSLIPVDPGPRICQGQIPFHLRQRVQGDHSALSVKPAVIFLQNFFPAGDRFCPVSNQIPAPCEGGISLFSGIDKYVPILILGVAGINDGPAFPGRLDQQYPAGKTGDQSVAHVKSSISGRLLGEEFAD